MDGHTFEYFCAEVLSLNGFSDVEVTQGSRDQGVDIIAYKDDIKYGIQCKCYSSDIGNKAVQEVYAGKNFYNLMIPFFQSMSLHLSPRSSPRRSPVASSM